MSLKNNFTVPILQALLDVTNHVSENHLEDTVEGDTEAADVPSTTAIHSSTETPSTTEILTEERTDTDKVEVPTPSTVEVGICQATSKTCFSCT